MKHTLILIFIILVGCTNETNKDECNPVGDWKLTIESTNGDCFDSVQRETFDLHVTKSDVKDLDGHCGGDEVIPIEYPETDENFGLEGILEFEITFQKKSGTGRGVLNAELLTENESIGTCTHNYKISGNKQ